jgi:uncharacterized membrane protein YhhN
MKKKAWLYLFVIVLLLDLVGILLHNETIQLVAKPLIVPSLLIYFIVATTGVKNRFKIWVLLALFFSWVGDVLLMFEVRDSGFFIVGLSSFLLAHFFYIIFFNKVRSSELIDGKWWLLLIVVLYYGFFITFISPYLGDMKLPVRIYAVMISIMFMLAMHMLYLKYSRVGILMMTGALLFVISDSVLAINKFYEAFEPAGFIIMLTYGSAQLLIVEGGRRYLTSTSKQ